MNNRLNLKNILNEDLKDLKVTEELKKKTLNKCKIINEVNKKVPPYMFFSIATIFMIILNLNTYNKLHKNSDFINDNKQIAKQDKIQKSKSNTKSINLKKPINEQPQFTEKNPSYEIEETNLLKRPEFKKTQVELQKKAPALNKKIQENKIVKNAIALKDLFTENVLTNVLGEYPSLDNHLNKSYDKTDDNKNLHNNDYAFIKNNGSFNYSSPKSSSISSKKEELKLPSYIPDGYNLNKISNPNPNNEYEELILTFSKDSSKFEIAKSKIIQNTFRSLIKDIDLSLIKDGIKYDIKGPLSKDILKKILNSIGE